MLARLAMRNPAAVFGAVVMLLFVAVALLAPALAPFNPFTSIKPLQLPGTAASSGGRFWLGTDLLGRDILSRMIYGTRTVLLWASLATLAAGALGVAAGLVAGYYRGWVDAVLSFVSNAILSFPVVILYIIIVTSLSSSGLNIVLAVAFASAPAIFRIVRALVMDVSQRDYVAAAVTQGASDGSIMLKEILPNVTGPLIADLCLRLGYSAITIGILGFLGLGLPPPSPDWGSMVADGKSMAIAFPHLVVFPCIAISLLMLGLSLLADGLQQASNRVTPT